MLQATDAPSNMAAPQDYIAMPGDIPGKPKNAIDAGKTAEEVKSMGDLTADCDAVHGAGFINPECLREIYRGGLTQMSANSCKYQPRLPPGPIRDSWQSYCSSN